MSTIKVNRLESTSTANGGIDIDTDGHVQFDGLQLPTEGALSNRNMFINGEAAVAQRSTSVTGVTTGGTSNQSVDLFRGSIASLGTWTNSQDTDTPDGFSKSFKLECTTANASPGSGSVLAIDLMLEAQNLQRLGYGTSGAKVATLSFYVKSNKTGAATVTILQPDNSNRCINPSYTINAADTWERKTITLPADTSGVINNDNGRGLIIEMWLNSGSTYTGGSNQNDWTTLDNTNRNASNLGLGGSTADYWQITGVQLEVGSKATPFEHESYSQTLAKCQRYYTRVIAHTTNGRMATAGNGSVAGCFPTLFLPTTMRAQPSIDVSSVSHFTTEGIAGGGTQTCTAISFNAASSTAVTLNVSASGGSSTATGGQLLANTTDAFLEIIAEL